jgi:transposase
MASAKQLADAIVDKSDDVVKAAPKRPNFTHEYRRSIVEMTMQPGASVSRIAREHGLNDNMVFKWRHRYRKELGATASTSTPVSGIGEAIALLPVNIIDTPSTTCADTSPATEAPDCEVEVEVGKRRVRIRGVSLEFVGQFLRDWLK